MALGALSAALGAWGCIQDEALNAECDVLRCSAHVGEVATGMNKAAEAVDLASVFFNPADADWTVPYGDSIVSYNVWSDADLSHVRLSFKLTEGATLYHADEVAPYDEQTVFDFTEPGREERFRTVSQDGQWSRNYTVRFKRQIGHQFKAGYKLHYAFEQMDVKENNRYEQWYETAGGLNDYCWASGNPGFKLSHSGYKLGTYPTISNPNGKEGKCVILKTRDTGDFGRMASMPIAAGNMFLGNFDITYAVRDAMQATQFGIPFFKQPQTFSGYYKYKSGPVYKNRKMQVVDGPSTEAVAGKALGKRDMASLYAIIYTNQNADGSAFCLHGNDVLECLEAATDPQWRAKNPDKQLHHVAIAAVGLLHKFGLRPDRPDPVETIPEDITNAEWVRLIARRQELEATRSRTAEQEAELQGLQQKTDLTSVEWRPFTEPFIYLSMMAPNNKEAFPAFNTDDLMNGKYNFTMCFSASKEGAEFCGAVDSELWVDEVTVDCVDGIDGLLLRASKQ